MYFSEFLFILAIVAATIAMFWFAESATQRVVALIAVVSCGYGVYDLSRPSQGGWFDFSGILGFLSLVVTVIMMIIYATTWF
jgi:hypothetical protein